MRATSDMWSNRGCPEEPKMAEPCGADEIRIDASTAAAVIIRASLFMILTRGFCLWDCCSFCGSRCNPYAASFTLPSRAIAGCPTKYTGQLLPAIHRPAHKFLGRHRFRMAKRTPDVLRDEAPLVSLGGDALGGLRPSAVCPIFSCWAR